ncbi:SAM-dependent methyltransferase [Sporomusa sp.]|uniref:SAM-dependent methyltransferase n=1 Tax=Sporomusa sp. TaxID=2078658 RepID=UPI002BB2F7F9|nr:class I SAM-dependent methyltransferase [Sporomusa sp.]HWR44843.1 class I SAM-dependent methyltransferase [Sporomusa sp.]
MFIKSNKYNANFVKENMMGPNAMKIMEELAGSLKLEEGMRVLDLGCGRGLTSIFLAKEYGVTVFATDLWISATDNYARIKAMGVEDRVIPIHAEAHDLPFKNRTKGRWYMNRYPSSGQ